MMKEAPKTLGLPRRRLPPREKNLNTTSDLLAPSLLPDPILWVVYAAAAPLPTWKTLDLGIPTASAPALPVPAAPSPDRSDQKKWRRLPDYFYQYRILPSWATVGGGVEAVGISEAAPCSVDADGLSCD